MTETNTTLIPKQNDGYSVSIDDATGLVTVVSRGRKIKMHVTYFRTFADLKNSRKNIVPANIRAAYAFGCVFPTDSITGIRDINGAPGKILAMADQARETAKKKHDAANDAHAKKVADRRAAILATAPKNSVLVRLKYHDGAPYAAEDNGVTIRIDDLTTYTDDGYGVIDAARLADIHAAEKNKQAAIDNKKQAELNRVGKIFDTARETGKKQMISHWVTDRCMNGHDDECSCDTAARWAMPDGSSKTEYTCCY